VWATTTVRWTTRGVATVWLTATWRAAAVIPAVMVIAAIIAAVVIWPQAPPEPGPRPRIHIHIRVNIRAFLYDGGGLRGDFEDGIDQSIEHRLTDAGIL